MPLFTKTDALLQLNGLYTRLAPSAYGVGVFAIRPITKGQNPFFFCREAIENIYVTEDDIKHFPPQIIKYICDFFPYNDTKKAYILPDYSPLQLDQAFFLNHSTTPNMAATEHGEQFSALRDIAEGEELTVDYTSYDDRGLDNKPAS